MLDLSQIKKKLADYCVYQDRSHYEVEQKLKELRTLNEDERGEILIWLIQNNFLNEERFSKSYARGKFYQKKWGKIKIKQGLKQKRIPTNLIDKGIEEINEDDYKSTLMELTEKKWNIIRESEIYLKKKKIYNYLLQKGYEYNLINEILKNY
ncbi:regulatory protein RecX [Apibacter sp. B3919]|uniref:regulatory protein RecX n=1 Tax=unclassified Apibacter TaxID=2630820 RepID=UPI00132BBA58|nr:regulatory protein RecX [Apibacter sp. B3919]MXO24177.1 recombinase RecX [Apibacter sp. B3924]MXO26959.1 recombinase RecX [Apibacter sp. B3813]MXO28913.1 recombinase RecX [Apibacter sp. B3913]MXO30864.1 recombinase RecX [Apibacter sp. B3912]MXP02121.1 recombinase RecX [Apibacter sp. B3918]